MNMPKPDRAAGMAQLPLPRKQFQRFVLVFHVVFVSAMLLVLFGRWQRAGFVVDAIGVVVTILVLLQVVCYIWFFALPAPPEVMRARWAFHFPVSFSLWFITWRLEPAFEWVVLGYIGQLFGAVPPKFSIPGAVAVFALYLPAKVGWAGLAQLSARQWLGYGAMAIVSSALGLFIHKLAVTSAERAKLIQELESAREELELARERDTELAALRERERLARELHDSIGHGLVTLTVQLEAAQRLYAVDPARATALMDGMKELTRTTMAQLRRSLAGLRAPGLGDRPLGQALQELCADTANRTGLKIECEIAEAVEGLTLALAEALWRVAQEGIANAEKHARATSARVALRVESNGSSQTAVPGSGARQVALVVSDDGVGLPGQAESKPGHYGLRGLRERVEGLGGTFRIFNGRPRGTVLEARFPLLS